MARRIWLVGESLPLTKASREKVARATSQLAEQLVCLDPRHGVFPNLVMKPLFAATLAAFKESDAEVMALLRAIEDVVCDKPDRRFNLYLPRITHQKNPESNRFAFDNLERRIQEFDPKIDLWLVFGHQTVSGLMKWLLECDEITTRSALRKFIVKFITASNLAKCATENHTAFRPNRPATGAGRIGFVHRLCTEFDAKGEGVEKALGLAVDRLNIRRKYSNEFIVSFLRRIIPLMHNEAYQDGQHPTGNAQGHFVKFATSAQQTSDLYWKIMGHAIARRFMNRWVGEPLNKG